jgi:hypothetical protein
LALRVERAEPEHRNGRLGRDYRGILGLRAEGTVADPSLAAVDVHRLLGAGLTVCAPLPQRTTNLELERTRGIRLFN